MLLVVYYRLIVVTSASYSSVFSLLFVAGWKVPVEVAYSICLMLTISIS